MCCSHLGDHFLFHNVAPPPSPFLLLRLVCLLKCLINVRNDVFGRLQTDGEADHVGRSASRRLLFWAHLRVGRGRGVNRERASITDVGHVADELEGVDEGGTSLARVGGLDAEDDHTATLALDVLDVLGVLGIVLEAGVPDPGDLGVCLEMLSDLEGVLAVAIHAKRQGLDALEEHPRVVGGLGGSDVAKRDGEHAELVREGRERLGEVVAPSETAVGGVRSVEERVPAGGPVETTLKCGNEWSEGQQESVQVLETKGRR